MSKFNYETGFLYHLFKENSDFIVLKQCKVIYWSAFYDVFIFLFSYTYIYTPSNQHFKAFLVSKFNSETSFLYQLFKENSNFIVTEPCKVIGESIFYVFLYYLYLFDLYLCIYTPSYPHFKAFPVSKFNSETSFKFCINFSRRIQMS